MWWWVNANPEAAVCAFALFLFFLFLTIVVLLGGSISIGEEEEELPPMEQKVIAQVNTITRDETGIYITGTVMPDIEEEVLQSLLQPRVLQSYSLYGDSLDYRKLGWIERRRLRKRIIKKLKDDKYIVLP